MQYACVATLAGFMMFYEPNCAVAAGAVTNLNFAMTPLLAPGQAHKRAHTHTHTHAHTRTRTTWALPFDPRLAPGLTSLCFFGIFYACFTQFPLGFYANVMHILLTVARILRVFYAHNCPFYAPTGRPFFLVFLVVFLVVVFWFFDTRFAGLRATRTVRTICTGRSITKSVDIGAKGSITIGISRNIDDY